MIIGTFFSQIYFQISKSSIASENIWTIQIIYI